jgi:hypothetical protein
MLVCRVFNSAEAAPNVPIYAKKCMGQAYIKGSAFLHFLVLILPVDEYM